MKNSEMVIDLLVGKDPVKSEGIRTAVLKLLFGIGDEVESGKRDVASCVVPILEPENDSVDVSKLTAAMLLAAPQYLDHFIERFFAHCFKGGRGANLIQTSVEGFTIGLIGASIELNHPFIGGLVKGKLEGALAFVLSSLLSKSELEPFSKEMGGRLSNLAPRYVRTLDIEGFCEILLPNLLVARQVPDNDIVFGKQPSCVWQIITSLTSQYFRQFQFPHQVRVIAGMK